MTDLRESYKEGFYIESFRHDEVIAYVHNVAKGSLSVQRRTGFDDTDERGLKKPLEFIEDPIAYIDWLARVKYSPTHPEVQFMKSVLFDLTRKGKISLEQKISQ